MIVDYMIAGAGSPQQLINEVSQNIQDGWEPTGGVFVFGTPNENGVQYHFIQAMVKKQQIEIPRPQ